MSYASTILNTPTPAATLMSTAQSLIDAHAAWEFVEQVVGSTATNICDVYRCLGTVNSFGTDFYVGFCRSGATPATAKCGFILGETYDTGAKTFGNGATWCLGTTSLPVETDFSYGTPRHVANENTMVAQTDGFLRVVAHMSTGSNAGMTPGTASQNFMYELSVTNDRIVLVTYIGISVLFSAYVGLYDSLHTIGVDPFPVVAVAAMSSDYGAQTDPVFHSNSLGGAFTRDAAWTGSIQGAFRASVSGHPWTWTRGSQSQWASNLSKETMSGKWWPSRFVLYPESRSGAIKGLLKPDILMLHLHEVIEAPGDVLTIDGVEYVCLSPSRSMYALTSGAGTINIGQSSWLSKAA